MAGIVNYYLDVFVPQYESSSVEVIDISPLIDYGKSLSPVVLQYECKDESVKILGAAIIANFCTSHLQEETYSKRILMMLTDIIIGSIDSPDIIAQQIFLMHLTKQNIDVGYFKYLTSSIGQMKVKNLLWDDEIEWVELAKQVIHHKQITKIINECIVDFGIETSGEDEEDEIKMTILENRKNTDIFTALQGFVGFKEIFINAGHFHQKCDNFAEREDDLLEIICKMDIISVVIHEFAHLKIRKCNGNFNMHTPVLAALQGIHGTEFGIYTEKKIFHKQVDWFLSAETVTYMTDFIDAIVNQTQLPPLSPSFIEGAVPRAGTQDVGGMDLYASYYLC